MKLTYLGHSAFEIKTGKAQILIDPYLVCKPNYDRGNVTDIFVTHGHGDHLGSAMDISRQSGAVINAVFELANYCSANKSRANGYGLGAWIKFPFGRAIFLPAFHSSSLPDGSYGGCAASIFFNIDNVRIYHAGDTCLHSEMKLVKELYRPNIAMLPIGGTYTMDAEHAAIAAQWIGAQTIIPIHYNTFPSIEADVQKFIRLLQAGNNNPLVLNPKEI